MSDDDAARAFWDEHHHIARDPDFWMAHPLCRRAINERICGHPDVWPLDAFRLLAGRRFRRGLSLGSGLGNLERAALRMNLCDEIEGIDASETSLAEARAAARAEGLTGVRYRLANLNSLELSRQRYDVVFFHQSLHHVRSMEKLLSRVGRALTPDGMLFLDEWTGPSRNEWTDARLARVRSLYAALPAPWRRLPALPAPIEANDPSEAVRSSAILPSVRRLFDVIAERPYGGHIVSILLPQLDRDHIPPGELDPLLRTWLALEAEDLARDPSLSWHTALAARPRRGGSALRAEVANFTIRLGHAVLHRVPAALRLVIGRPEPQANI